MELQWERLKNNAGKTPQGSNRWAGLMQSSVCCLFFLGGGWRASFSFSVYLAFFTFCSSIGHQKNEKGIGRYIGGGERVKEGKNL